MNRSMKDSGVAWIGEIPSDWEVSINKTVLRNVSVRNHPDAEVLSLYRDWGVVPKNSRDDNHNVTSEKTEQYKFVESGDLVINKMKAWQGSLAVSEYEGIVSPAYYVCKFKNEKMDKKYIHHLLRSCVYAQQFECLSTGMRIGQWDLSIDDFLTSPLLIPSTEEQIRISNEIDRKCSEVDTLIANQQKQIEKLKQYKQSLVTEVVTKGLNPGVEMKDSGVEWIGVIPKHWGYLKSFYVYDKIGDVDHYMPETVLEGFPYVMTGDLKNVVSDIDFEACKKISTQDYEQLSKKIIPNRGDILFARYATIGTVCYVDIEKEFIVSYSCVTIKPKKSVADGKYLWYYYQSTAFLEEVKKLINANTQANVGMDSLYRANLVIPPLNEQEQIASFLDEKCSKIDSLIAIKQQKIEKLNQYKKSIIYEYVTGKKEA